MSYYALVNVFLLIIYLIKLWDVPVLQLGGDLVISYHTYVFKFMGKLISIFPIGLQCRVALFLQNSRIVQVKSQKNLIARNQILMVC
jgi:hypothetical protein